MSKSLPKSVSKLLIATLLCLTFSERNQANAASGRITFSAYLLPKQDNATVEYPQNIVSFSDQVMLPMPANMSPSVEVRVISGSHSYMADSKLLSVYDGAGNYSNFFQIELGTANRQLLEVCETGARRCVKFNIVRAD